MKKSIKRSLIVIAVSLFMGVVPYCALTAQIPPPALPDGPSQAPIDGGLSILAVAGGAYALKKMRAKK